MTDPPMYNVASAILYRSLAIVRSLPLPGCDCGYRFIKTNFTRITNNRVSDLHIMHLVRCNSELYFK